MARVREVIKRTLKSFYDDQMTHHAAALTYYSLMSLFPAALIGVSLLGLLGQYPQTYDAIIGYLRDVAPDSTVGALDATLRNAFRSKGLAATTLAIGAIIALYGATGVLEAARRAMNVSFEVQGGRGFLQRKKTDLISSLVLGSLVLLTLILVFVGGDFAADLLGFVGLGSTAAEVWASPAGPPPGLRRCSRSPGSTTSLPMSGTVGSDGLPRAPRRVSCSGFWPPRASLFTSRT